MALRHHRPDLLQDEEFAEVRGFLAEHRLRPDDEPGILAALRERGWDLALDRRSDGWTVRVWPLERPDLADKPILDDADRQRALMRGVGLALGWLTPREAEELFNRDTTTAFGMTSEEFLRRLDAGELDVDDPRVIHLSMLRPVTL